MGCASTPEKEALRRKRISASQRSSAVFIAARQRGEKHYEWKGRKATYSAFHKRVARQRGKAMKCEQADCPKTSRRYEWASLTKRYHDINDYLQMCKACHARYDKVRPPSILSEADVREIRRLRYKVRHKDIAKMFGVSKHAIDAIFSGNNWSHVV